MIFTVFAIAEIEKLEGRPVSVLVICPLKSIISDQIVQLEGLCSAAEFTPESSKKIIEDPPIFIYCSAVSAGLLTCLTAFLVASLFTAARFSD